MIFPRLMQYNTAMQKYRKLPEILLILAINFSPLISKFYQLATWNFFGLVIQLKFF